MAQPSTEHWLTPQRNTGSHPAQYARNAEVLFPYLNGEDLNSRPDASASRWVIDFGAREEAAAAQYHLPYGRLRERVRPERAKLKIASRRDYWWRFAASAPSMRRAITGLSHVLVIALVSKTVMPLRVSAGQVFSHALGVFATDSYGDQAVLSSSLHQLWAITYGSGMRNDPRYTPSDVFETFPRPTLTEGLTAIGRMLDDERRTIMRVRDLGVTQLYNLVNSSDLGMSDPDIARIRQLHEQLDRVVLHAYGWDDIDPGHGFHIFRKMRRWTVSPSARVEILDRLLEENHLRASEQAGSDLRDSESGEANSADGLLFE